MTNSIQASGSEERWRSNYQNAWSALQMIRETVEAVCPTGALPSQEAVLGTRGPEPVHEAEAICEAIATLSPAAETAPDAGLVALQRVEEIARTRVASDPVRSAVLRDLLSAISETRAAFASTPATQTAALRDALQGLIDFIEIDRLPMNSDAMGIARAALSRATGGQP